MHYLALPKNYNVMKKIFVSVAFLGLIFSAQAQKYEFQTVTNLEALPVISQGNSGTCWSFSASSFLESKEK